MAGNTDSAMLNSWKEIAGYLDRGIRTVQRWEHGLHLPVHRIGSGKRSPVFANRTELNFWLSTTEVNRPLKLPPSRLVPPPPCVRGATNPRLLSLRELRQSMRNLSHAMAEASARQRRQAEIAKERMIELRSRIHPAG